MIDLPTSCLYLYILFLQDGGWSDYFGEWSTCSKSCRKHQMKSCTNPTPAYGGQNCSGTAETRFQFCNDGDCLGMNDGCFELQDLSENYDIKSFPMSELNNSVLECQSRCQSQDNCQGFTVDLLKDQCILKDRFDSANHITNTKSNFFLSGPKNCPVHGNWSDYELWLPCSKSCGLGTKRRFRYCTNPVPDFGGNPCQGSKFEDSECFTNCSTGMYVNLYAFTI